MNIDANKVIEKLTVRIGELEREKAVMAVALETLSEQTAAPAGQEPAAAE